MIAAAGQASALGFAAFLLIAIAVNVTYFARRAHINRTRKRAGHAGLSEQQVASLRRLGVDPDTATSDDIAAANALTRQMAWEKFEMQSEMMKGGRASSRAYCREHDRHCKYPSELPHDPGGNRNTTPPEGWEPQSTKIEGVPRKTDR